MALVEVWKVDRVGALSHLTRHRINRFGFVLDPIGHTLGILLMHHSLQVLQLGLWTHVQGHYLMLLVPLDTILENIFDVLFSS